MLEWKKENEEWYCYDDSEVIKGWLEYEPGAWYHFDESTGKMDTGWVEIDSRWYYLYLQNTDNTSKGQMATGWFQIDSSWYYFYTKKTEKDGNTHYTGEMAVGWIEIDSRWYYLYPEQVEKDGDTHYKGEMATGWIQLDSNWYYLYPEKTEAGGNTHYAGEMAASITLEIDNKNYTFNEDGSMLENRLSGDSLVSDDLVNFVAGWESFRERAYEDPYYPGDQSKWTIGYGTCYCCNSSAFPDGLESTCTKDQALSWLQEEINKVAKTIKAGLNGVSLSQQAFDCLCDIGYNAGTAYLIGGETWNSIINGDSDLIRCNLMKWNKANGVVSEGLTKRCEARVNMCLYGIYDSTH